MNMNMNLAVAAHVMWGDRTSSVRAGVLKREVNALVGIAGNTVLHVRPSVEEDHEAACVD
jgi:hypothetical protein